MDSAPPPCSQDLESYKVKVLQKQEVAMTSPKRALGITEKFIALMTAFLEAKPPSGEWTQQSGLPLWMLMRTPGSFGTFHLTELRENSVT